MKIKEITSIIEQIAPLKWQEDYDNAGLIVGEEEKECTGVMICLDVFSSTLDEAIEKHCNLVIAHHPFIFHGVKKIYHSSDLEKILLKALSYNIAIYAAHTNLDSSTMGVNYALSKKLHLHDIEPLDNREFKGEEYYLGQGAIGTLEKEIKVAEYLNIVKQELNRPLIYFIGSKERKVKRIGFCGGSGDFLVEKAIERGCDMFLTGDVKYHDFLSNENRIVLADIGHFESEQFIKQQILDIISKKIRNFVPSYLTEEKNRINFI